MPVHVIPQAKLTITFVRGGEALDTRMAPTGERALKVAILMLAELDALENGDGFDCHRKLTDLSRPLPGAAFHSIPHAKFRT